MNKVENMNNKDTIEIIIFGKPKMVEVISTGDNQFDEEGNYKEDNFELSESEINCLNWFISNVRIDELPFDSDRKMMSTINKCDDEIKIYTKGSFDSLIIHC